MMKVHDDFVIQRYPGMPVVIKVPGRYGKHPFALVLHQYKAFTPDGQAYFQNVLEARGDKHVLRLHRRLGVRMSESDVPYALIPLDDGWWVTPWAFGTFLTVGMSADERRRRAIAGPFDALDAAWRYGYNTMLMYYQIAGMRAGGDAA